MISIGTKKKENMGNFKNGGREWLKKGQPPDAEAYGSIDPGLGKGIPYGVYGIKGNNGRADPGAGCGAAGFAAAPRWRVKQQPARQALEDGASEVQQPVRP
jgi:hypothetical protein